MMIIIFSGPNESRSAFLAMDLTCVYCLVAHLPSALYTLNRSAWAVQTGCRILIVLDISSKISLQVMLSISLSQDCVIRSCQKASNLLWRDVCLRCSMGLPPSVEPFTYMSNFDCQFLHSNLFISSGMGPGSRSHHSLHRSTCSSPSVLYPL